MLKITAQDCNSMPFLREHVVVLIVILYQFLNFGLFFLQTGFKNPKEDHETL